jgi:glucosamine-6-phosphate deaminase
MMRLIVCDNQQEIANIGADMIAEVVENNPTAVLGLATGSTPVPMYKELIRRYEAGKLDFSTVRSVNLDEYYPLAPDNDQSYRYFMNHQLFDHINIDKNNTSVPDGLATDPAAACAAYEALIRELGGIDIQVLGIGGNGHIGFNEPAEALDPLTHLTDLTEDTIRANARFFESEEDVPRHALTMGIGTILSARRIMLIATGEAKAKAIATVLSGKLTTSCPASMLNLHSNVTILCDRAAVSLCDEATIAALS